MYAIEILERTNEQKGPFVVITIRPIPNDNTPITTTDLVTVTPHYHHLHPTTPYKRPAQALAYAHDTVPAEMQVYVQSVPEYVNVIRQHQHVSVRSFFMDQAMYYNFPAYQRTNDQWSLHDQKLLIDSILRGLGIGNFQGYRGGDNKIYNTDGQQRLTAILAFASGQFPTFTEARFRSHNAQLIPAIEPGKYAWPLFPPADGWKPTKQHLSAFWNERFWNYTLDFQIGTAMPEVYRALEFERHQGGVSITGGHHFNMYTSGTREFATHLEHLPVWDSLFRPHGVNAKKRQRLVLAVYAIHMSLFGIPASLRLDYLNRLAAGWYDDKMTHTRRAEIKNNLLLVAHLFDGITFSAMSNFVLLYQAIQQIQWAGIDG